MGRLVGRPPEEVAVETWLRRWGWEAGEGAPQVGGGPGGQGGSAGASGSGPRRPESSVESNFHFRKVLAAGGWRVDHGAAREGMSLI